MDFTFNRLCDQHPIGSRVDGALLVSVVTPLNDDYESFSNGKCILESSAEGGYVLIKLGNEESLGRELRIYLQTEKYVKNKNDGTLPESTKRILRGISEDNQDRQKRLVALLGEMLAGACPGAPKSGGDYYVAGQSIKLKSATPISALGEALEYLVRNTFTKMSYLKRTSPEPLKEVQAILHSNDIAQQTLALGTEEGNQQAIADLRGYIELCTHASRQIVLHDVIEKRYSLRPYGWPDEEVLILVAHLLVLGEIRLMMDGALVPPDKAYEAIATPGKRRKVLLVKRRTSDPKALQNARGLGKELFHEMGPDGEDALFSFLQNRLKSWQSSLNGYKPLADTGNYPGKDEIADGRILVKKLLAWDIGDKFIEQFNETMDEVRAFLDALGEELETKGLIRASLDEVTLDPFKGSELQRELSGFRSLKPKRFRVIYKVNEVESLIEVYYVGPRRDVYESFRELLGGI